MPGMRAVAVSGQWLVCFERMKNKRDEPGDLCLLAYPHRPANAVTGSPGNGSQYIVFFPPSQHPDQGHDQSFLEIYKRVSRNDSFHTGFCQPFLYSLRKKMIVRSAPGNATLSYR